MSILAPPTQQAYEDFLATKRIAAQPVGFDVAPETLNGALKPFQAAIVRWALRRGRAAIFADCGLGKTLMQLEWARHVHQHTGMPVFILAPLAVAEQTKREGKKFGIPVTVCATDADVPSDCGITNYEKLHHFTPGEFGGIVLDESSILKAFSGSTRKAITEFAKSIPFRLACTATPAPNDLIELCNHSEFLDVMSGKEIIALFFTQDGNTTHAWRLKGHARNEFWRWLASWSVALRRPSDLGFSNEGYELPPLQMHQIEVQANAPLQTYLVPVEAVTLDEQRQARRDSLTERVQACAALVNTSTEPWVVWCDLNAESEALARDIPDAVEIRGSDSDDHKTRSMLQFSEGTIRVIVSKPSICGHGMNWQHCAKIAFVGLSHSFEQVYQATRRCWRFGQVNPVDCYVIISETEGAVVRNIQRKERQATEMMEELVKHMAGLTGLTGQSTRDEMTYREDVATGRNWALYLGDSVQQLRHVADDTVGLTVTSPPFPGMYTYTNSTHDIGNTTGIEEMIDHFRYLMPELLRVTMPGRMCCIHLMQLTAMKNREGYIGVKDYRGRVIAAMEETGWVYAGEVTIDKNPQVQATRNKERGLLFKTLATDSSLMRMALADYLIYFRKPGENPRPIRAGISQRYDNPNGWITEEEWIEWAAPVWYRQQAGLKGGIRETDVLNVAQAKETDDERHLCPLQLGVIERAIKLWSAPGDLVLDPFNGIGSVGHQALRFGRRYVGVELKESYWRNSIRNLKSVEQEVETPTLFDLLEEAA